MARSTPSVRLASRALALRFSPETGSLLSIEDRTRKVTHAAAPGMGRLFRVVCPSATWLARFADSQESGPPAIEQGPGWLSMRWERLAAMDGEMPVAVTVRVELTPEASEAVFSIDVVNNGPDLLHEVHFPRLGGLPGISGPGADRFLCGINPVDPHATFNPAVIDYNLGGSKRRRMYPHHLALLPMMDFSGKGAGISSICRVPGPCMYGIMLENFDPEPGRVALGWTWVHYPFLRQGGEWSAPTVDLGVHAGDWHDTADRLKAWRDTWWKRAVPVNGRLRRAIGIQVIQNRGFDGAPFHQFADMAEVARAGAALGVDDLCIWDPIGEIYLRPDDRDFWEEPDPERGLGDLMEGLRAIRAQGVHVSTLVNYRLAREASQLWGRFAEEQASRTVHGAPVMEDVSHYTGSHAAWLTGYLGRQGVTLCPKSGGFRRRALEITRKTLALGFDSLFVDQAFDPNPCFSTEHGHAHPGDTHEAALEWSLRAMEMVRAPSTDGYVLGELCDLFSLQHFDASWIWHALQPSLAVPEVLCYVVPEVPLLLVVDRQQSTLGRAFALGSLAAFTTRELEASLADYPAFGAHVEKMAALRRATAFATVEGRFLDDRGLTLRGCTGHVFESANAIGVTLAETAGAPAAVRARLDLKALGRAPAGEARVYLLGGKTAPAPAATPARAGLQLDLPAWGAAVWVVPCRPRETT